MSDQSNANNNAETPPGADGTAQASSLAQPSAESSVNEPEPFTELENLHAEVAALKDRLLRTMAEAENVRRRAEKEVADARVYGVSNLAREMLAFADNLRRAAESVPAEARATLDPVATALLDGLEVTERDFLSRLGRFGVKQIEALGAKFDPNLHEALYEIPDETKPAGTVAQVMEQGYTIGERVLRPAKVGVTRGGPRA
ncbi:nucleotide exchange factor GrpE [Methylocystis echinoides]|uniref:Protein GrpE n=1 Tax=Methylocystis echinoides TaxID=29468 RepID=A0A9W6LT70_9HYPH|nr:nucleotide exchange factor GrpE [Methylocystis echinoides]GLI94328.1 protein GrpE [Methylocystis echinoides]